ncbi:MAG: DUF6114 domain-containing protein [Haloarculaceae archaeon]
MAPDSTVPAALRPIERRVDDRVRRFNDWRSGRPFAGGALLLLASVVIAYVPMQMAGELLMFGNAISAVGLLFAGLVAIAGLLALAEPEHSTYVGAFGILAAMLSVFGALGGLVVGTLLGVLGGSLCVGWTDEPAVSDDEPDEDNGWRFGVKS